MKRVILVLALGVTVVSGGAAGWLWLRPPDQQAAGLAELRKALPEAFIYRTPH